MSNIEEKVVGRFGEFGGQYIPETLMNEIHKLEEAYEHYKNDPEFVAELDKLNREYAGRPSLLYYAEKMTRDLGGAKMVTVNANANGQKFTYPVYLNGKPATAADGITLVDKSGAASYENGILTIAYKSGIKNGTRTATLKKGNASFAVKVKVSSLALDKSVSLRIQSRLDVVTGSSMVIIPNLSNVDGRITKVEINSVSKCDKNDFYAEFPPAGNIIVSYDGNALSAKNMSIGDMSLKLTVTDSQGKDTIVNTTLRNVRAKKTLPKVTAVKMSVSKSADGMMLGVVNLVSTYRDTKGAWHQIAPVSTKIVAISNVEASVNANDPSQIDISNANTKGVNANGRITVELTYAGGVTKKINIQIMKTAK